MKFSAFCALFFVVGAALVFVTFSSPIDRASWFLGLFATKCGERRTVFAIGRKLKENGRDMRSNYIGDMGTVTLDDYNPTNPKQDAGKYVIGGPIEHMPKPKLPPRRS
ncbi:unnamed protein product [Lupinus luteus]|uniref:Uncharacterized protein n=1 Tax=Lupinus luteus TaxID=3873 RepID=A0AAV1Y0Y0_LUPLU